MSESNLLKAALYYAGRGWHVFPVHSLVGGRCDCGKSDCQNPGKHPRTRNGLNDATTNPATIKEWWQKWTYANVGIRCGAVSGLVVIDVDPRHGGDESLFDLAGAHGNLPHTVEALTGGGGRHILFRHPGVKVKTAKNVLGAGLDIRADGGYVVASPSLHASGNRYQWEPSCLPSQTALAALPDWMLALLRDDTPEVQQRADPVGEKIPAGLRNQTLTSLAGTMRRRGMSRDAVYAALWEENTAKCDPPLSPDEVMTIAKSVGRYMPTATTIPASQKSPVTPRDPMDAYGVSMAFLDLLDNLEGRSVPTHIVKMDEALGGIERQTLTILAARPSMGKTTLAWQIARNVAASGQRAYFFSLEMSATSLWAKAACGALGIRWKDVRSGAVTDEQITMIIDMSVELMNRYAENLLIDDGTNTSETIWTQVERYKPDLVVIDHLRLVADHHDKEDKRLGIITQRLKDMAKGFNAAVICLAQLNRQVESQTEKRPTLGDLRDSGQIEENADVVLMMYRDDYYNDEQTGGRYSLTEVLVRKFRDDIMNQRIKLAFDKRHQWFDDPTGKFVNLNEAVQDWTR
jgi:KaiC/GvpD/RAD55 family RecA-like ATPase